MIKYSILASGSTGNAIYVGSQEKNILVDAGVSGRRMSELLAEIDVAIEELDAIFVTHEHDDHVRGVGVLARRYNIPIYLNYNTYQSLPKAVGSIDESLIKIIETGAEQRLGDMLIESFGVSHDASEPVGYILSVNGYRLSIITDLGYVSNRIKSRIKGSHAFIIETNHCVEMLQMGSYPWELKRRILSDLGHLSNDAAAEALAEIVTGDTELVHLFHRSQENNQLDLARLTVIETLERYQMIHDRLKILDTYPDQPTSLEIIGT